MSDDRPGEEASSEPDGESASGGGSEHRRDVVVPMELYKVVTVFSTLFAIVLVVAGMIALDLATNRGAATREEVDLLAAVAGVGAIVGGAAVYAFSTRFRAAGMGNPKDADDEQSNDGRRVR